MRDDHSTADLDIIAPVSLDLDWPTKDSTVRDILEQYREYGIHRFALAVPCGGWRSIGYPSVSFIEEKARLFAEVRKELEPYGIECGWWNTLTIKSGISEGFQPIIKGNGEPHPFANCPLGETFKTRFSQDIALFSKIAKPAFIITEDDFSVNAAGGCYCDEHLKAFGDRYGTYYSREELTHLLAQKTPEAIELARKWREVTKDSLVALGRSMREELDKETPEIPMGTMQAGSADADGDTTEDLARAMAGGHHVPFSRLFGMWYGDIQPREMGEMLYHALYSKQHMKHEFAAYYEADAFPHTRFFIAGCKMKAALAMAFSYGFDGATFQTQQLLDDANEEKAHGKMYAAERARFNAIHRLTKDCRVKGVQVAYDPFWNTLDNAKDAPWPLWIKCVSRFGIPYTTEASNVIFWDERQAQYADDAAVRDAFSRNLFLDGDAAKCLYERGYGDLMGVRFGGEVTAGTRLPYDLGAREVLRAPFAEEGKGHHMTSPWMYCPQGNGKMYKMEITDANCEEISELYSYDKKRLTTAMTRFENSLGGKVVIMGLTLSGNNSQALYNYRRKRLMRELLLWCQDEYVLVNDAPDVLVIENESKDEKATGFCELLTLINLCEDDLDEVKLHLPPQLREGRSFYRLNIDGEWEPLAYEKTEDGISFATLEYCEPAYILIK